MTLLRTVLAVAFVLMGLGIFRQFISVRRYGLLLGAATYGGAGVLALTLAAWWPLPAGFATAWVLRRLGAEPPTDFRLDLPVLHRDDVTDSDCVATYVQKWVEDDPQVALVGSSFVREAWKKGLRRPPAVAPDAAWMEADAVSALGTFIGRDVQHLVGRSRSDFVRQLDAIGMMGEPTLIVAGELTVRHDLPSKADDFVATMNRIPEGPDRTAYATSYVADAVLAARFRILAWTFQSWHGERYVPSKTPRTIG